MDTDPHSYLIVKTIVNLAHSLNMQIIAEGIETFNQIEILKSLNCDIGQGYYYCKPLFTEDLISYINKLNIADNDLMINNIY